MNNENLQNENLELKETVKKLEAQLQEASSKLINSQNELVKEIEKVQEEERKKSDKEIKTLKQNMNDEIAIQVIEELKGFQKTPKIVECCENIEENIGKLSAELIALCSGYENIDFISKERIFGVINYMKITLQTLQSMI